MGTIREQMQVILGESPKRTEQEEGGEEHVPLANFKPLIQQLVLAMQAMGMNASDDEEVDAFLKMLKAVSTTKASMFRQALRQWSGAKAAKAVKVAKATI